MPSGGAYPMDQCFIDRVYEGFEYERSRKEPPADFPVLLLIPGGRYTDPDFLELEQKFLWKKSWLYACHSSELPHKGSYILWNKTGSPILIVRGEDDQVRAFYNTCRHRGGPLVTASSGKVSGGLTCVYHGWSFDLEGKLRGVRDRRDFSDLDFSCLGLVTVRCETLGNWVFVNEDAQADSLLQSLGPISHQMQQFNPASIRLVESYGFDIECNVKLMMEAFFEVYHLKSIHRDTVDRFLEHRATRITLWPKGHSLMVTPNRQSNWIDPSTIGMLDFPNVSELPVRTNVSYNFYPGLVTPVAPTGMPFLTFCPTSARTMRIDCHWFAPDWGEDERHPLWDQRISNFNRILQEDMELIPKVQQSIESPGFEGVRLNYQERRIYHWHEELDRRIGIDQIPEHLRVEPRLADMVER
jgi:phenylpropionate dioxygenase-like ring-hydroxylating dioxygenase large terminal subunit